MSDFRDIISVHSAKRAEVEQALAQTFFLYVNVPDDATDRQGYLVMGSPLVHESDRFDHFRYFVIGARSADIRDVEELLAYGDAEARSEYSEEGDDYHAIVGARLIAEYKKLMLRSGDEPLGMAVETVLRDETGEMIVIHYDGEYKRIPLDRKNWVRFLGGSKESSVVVRVFERAQVVLSMEVFHPDQMDKLMDSLKAVFPSLNIVFWKLNFVVAQDPEPKKLED